MVSQPSRRIHRDETSVFLNVTSFYSYHLKHLLYNFEKIEKVTIQWILLSVFHTADPSLVRIMKYRLPFSFSNSGGVLCGVGKDNHGKQVCAEYISF